MHIPAWKRWWSYISDVHLESVESEHSDVLHVYLSKGRLQLCTDKAIYSWADKYENFLEAFKLMDLPKHGSDVLILGFGMGSIPWMLEHEWNKKYNYTGVELDEEVIYLASKYTLPQLSSEIAIIQADAHYYTLQETRQYDLVCMDIFVDDQIPDVFLSMDFLQGLKECIAPSGQLVFNHLANSDESQAKAEQYFNEVFKPVFPNAKAHQILGNLMLVG